MKTQRAELLRSSSGQLVRTKRTWGTTSVTMVGDLIIEPKTHKGTQGVSKFMVRLSHHFKVNQKAARVIFAIASTPISDDQRIKAAKLADKAKAAQKSAVTARFRKTAA